MHRRPALALLAAAAALAGLTGCTPGSAATDGPTPAATAASASGTPVSATLEPAVATEPPALSVAPTPTAAEPGPTRTAEPYDWAPAALWRLCQASWEASDPAVTWKGWDPFDPMNTSTEAGGFSVARYRTDENGTVVVDVRDCRITGTPSDYEVIRTPPQGG